MSPSHVTTDPLATMTTDIFALDPSVVEVLNLSTFEVRLETHPNNLINITVGQI